MDFIYTFLIFVVVLFVYLHIVAQRKKSQDLEVYEMDYQSNQGLQDVCDLKQPVLFRFSSIDPVTINKCLQKSSFDVNVKSTEDYYGSSNTIIDYVDPVVLTFSSFNVLIKTNEKSAYFTEDNERFVDDAGLYADYKELDDFLKPPIFISQTKYDLWTGSPLSYTPLRYHTNYRQFLYVTSGKIRVKMTPWKSSRYLDPIHDYENYEFWSPIRPSWKSQGRESENLQKIKFLEFDVLSGFVLYLPPYWWYSIQYGAADTVIMSYTYNSVMNIVANIPYILRHYVQISHTKRRVLNVYSEKAESSNPDPNPDPTPVKEGENKEKKDSTEMSNILPVSLVLPVKLTEIDFANDIYNLK